MMTKKMMMRLSVKNFFFHILVLFFCSPTCSQIVHRQKQTNFVKHTGQYIVTRKLLDGYSKQDPPTADRPTNVLIGINVNSMYSISDERMDYAINLYLRQSWQDPRLAFKSPDGKLHQMKMDDAYWTKIWVPDVFFRNEKTASYHSVTVPNRLLRINSTGHIWHTVKITATLSCPMNLRRYPMDTQICPIMFESYGYTKSTMLLDWLDNAVSINKEDLQLPQFDLAETLKFDCSQNYTTGAYPCLQINFVLNRDIGFFIIQVYVPSILIVILSWVSFWINIDASPARVSLGLLTVLTTTTMSSSVRETLPRVSYIKAIDIWLIVCLVFVFASLIEYAVVNVISRRQVRPAPASVYRPGMGGVGGVGIGGVGGIGGGGGIESTTAATVIRRNVVGRFWSSHNSTRTELSMRSPDPDASKKRARGVDKLSRKCFPTGFVLFNIIYWITYTVLYTK